MPKFVLVEEDETSGPYRWTNINRRDYFSFEGAWAESFDSEEWAIHAGKQRTKEGWIVNSYHEVGYTINLDDEEEIQDA